MSSSLNPISFAMRHPISVMAGVVALATASFLAVGRMAIDVFPALDWPWLVIVRPAWERDLQKPLWSADQGRRHASGIFRRLLKPAALRSQAGDPAT